MVVLPTGFQGESFILEAFTGMYQYKGNVFLSSSVDSAVSGTSESYQCL